MQTRVLQITTLALTLSLLSIPALDQGPTSAQDANPKSAKEEASRHLPAIDALVSNLSRLRDKPVERAAAVFTIEEALSALKYYLAIPTGVENEKLADAVRNFQNAIGSKPTGILTVAELDILWERQALVTPKEIYPSPRRWVDGNAQFAFAEGTWVFENEKQAYPIQTSKVDCWRDRMTCEHTLAEISEFSQLIIHQEVFKVTKWTDVELVAENHRPRCVSYTLSINFQNQQVYQFRRGKGGQGCEGIAEKPQILRLEDGFKVGWEYYKEQGQKALEAYNPEYSKHLKRFRELLQQSKPEEGRRSSNPYEAPGCQETHGS
jgi:peptidoglycan hydrolase-like protein with peptidoglycan-binding domain